MSLIRADVNASAPGTPGTGKTVIYPKSDGSWYSKNDAGTETGLGVTFPVSVPNGGTGDTTLAAHGVLVGAGASAVAVTGAGTTGQVLTSNGASADPTFQAAAGGIPNPITQDLLFTDATYDIGKSGATRPRDGFFSRNFTLGGLLKAVGGLLGTATNDDAAAGNVGEYVSATLGVGSELSLTTATVINVTSISLTAGDWDVAGTVQVGNANANPVFTSVQGGASTTSATLPSVEKTFAMSFHEATSDPAANVDSSWVIPTQRFSLATTTTVYLVGKVAFSVGTLSIYGSIRARRVR